MYDLEFKNVPREKSSGIVENNLKIRDTTNFLYKSFFYFIVISNINLLTLQKNQATAYQKQKRNIP